LDSQALLLSQYGFLCYNATDKIGFDQVFGIIIFRCSELEFRA